MDHQTIAPEQKLRTYKYLILGLVVLLVAMLVFFVVTRRSAPQEVQESEELTAEVASTTDSLSAEVEAVDLQDDVDASPQEPASKAKATVDRVPNIPSQPASAVEAKNEVARQEIATAASLGDTRTTKFLEELYTLESEMLYEKHTGVYDLEASDIFSLESYRSPSVPSRLALVRAGLDELSVSEAIAQELYQGVRNLIDTFVDMTPSQRSAMHAQLDAAIEKRPTQSVRAENLAKLQTFYESLERHYAFLDSQANAYRVSNSVDTGWVLIVMDDTSLQSKQDALLSDTVDQYAVYQAGIDNYLEQFRSIPDDFTAYVITQASQGDFDYLLQQDINAFLAEQKGVPYYEEPWLIVTRFDYVDGQIEIDYKLDINAREADPDAGETYIDDVCNSSTFRAVFDRVDMLFTFQVWDNGVHIDTVNEFVPKGERCSSLF